MLLTETVRIVVRFSEVDAVRIVWHGSYVAYLEDAREAFGRKYGLSYKSYIDNGYIAPIADMHLSFKQSATIDDVLLVEITYRHSISAKLIFDYNIYKESDHALVLTAESTQLFVKEDGTFEVSCPDFLTKWKQRWNYD